MNLTENPDPPRSTFKRALTVQRQTDRFTTLAKGNTPAAPKEKAAEN